MENLELGAFWERKLRSYTRALDLDQDGKVTKADYESLADRYLSSGTFSQLQATQIRRKLIAVWNEFFEASSVDGALDVDGYLLALRTTSRSNLIRIVVEFVNLFFDLVDVNGDGIIQKEEYAVFLKAFLVEDPKQVEASFQVLDTDGDGKLSNLEFINGGIEFFLSDDESLPSKSFFGPLA